MRGTCSSSNITASSPDCKLSRLHHAHPTARRVICIGVWNASSSQAKNPRVYVDSTKETCKAIYLESSLRIPIKENKAESRNSLDAYAK